MSQTTLGIPEQLSVDPAYPGYSDAATAVGMNLLIRLDGVEQRQVVAYDTLAGSITRARCDEVGELVIEGDHVALETLHGAVEVVRKST